MLDNNIKTSITGIQSISYIALTLLLTFASGYVFGQESDSLTERRISVAEYRDRMTAGWIGQMAGVGWGFPTEFQFNGVIIPEDKVPEWNPDMVNVFAQDDMYVEMTFLRTMEEYGIDVPIKQAGIDFANSSYMLWVANRVGRENLRKGIPPPNSGHPQFNPNADAIDYQIEADYSGLIAPGLPNTAVVLGEKFGRIMNYGDGLYGGQFVGAMYAEAFFERDPRKIVEAGLQYIPSGSQYAEAIRDVLKWHLENPNDWEKTWNLINEKYHLNPEYRKFTSTLGMEQNIDAKLNGAYIVMGLLYGNSDPDNTIVISMRCGQDSDCNPSNAGGILFTALGMENVPDRFTSALDRNTKFSFTDYNFDELLDVSEKFAIEFVKRSGGRIETDPSGDRIMVIPIQDPKPSRLEQSWDPGPIAQVDFTKEELGAIKGSPIFNYILIAIFLLAVILLPWNRNLKTLSIIIPFLLVYLLMEWFKNLIPPDLLSTVNLPAIFQAVSAGLAVVFLISKDEKQKNNLLVAYVILVLAVITFLGAIGTTDGRFMAATKVMLYGIGMQVSAWFVASFLTVLFLRNNYQRLKFNLIYIGTLFVSEILVFFVVSRILANTGGPFAAMTGNFSFLIFGALFFAIILYIVTVPYFILVRYSDPFKVRFNNYFT